MASEVFTYLQHLNLPVSKRYTERCITSHPDYSSLLSISDTLRRLGIEHQTARIDENKLGSVSFPYLLQSDTGGQLAIIKDKDDLGGDDPGAGGSVWAKRHCLGEQDRL